MNGSLKSGFFLVSMVLTVVSGCVVPMNDNSSPELDNLNTPQPVGDGDLVGYWVKRMDPYISQQPDWTFTFDTASFLDGVTSEHPEVTAYFDGLAPATADTEMIEQLIDGIALANVEMLILYEQNQAIVANGGYAWSSNNVYWFGRQDCFGGGTEDWMLGVMRTTYGVSYLASRMGVPAYIVSRYIGAMVNSASWCDANRGYFCITYSWSGAMWVNC